MRGVGWCSRRTVETLVMKLRRKWERRTYVWNVAGDELHGNREEAVEGAEGEAHCDRCERLDVGSCRGRVLLAKLEQTAPPSLS